MEGAKGVRHREWRQGTPPQYLCESIEDIDGKIEVGVATAQVDPEIPKGGPAV